MNESKYNIDLIYDKAVAIVKRHKNDPYPNWDIIEKELAAEASKPLKLAKEILAHEGFTDLFLSQPHSLEAMQKHTSDVVAALLAAPLITEVHLTPRVESPALPVTAPPLATFSIDLTIAAEPAALPVVAPEVASALPVTDVPVTPVQAPEETPELMQEDDEADVPLAATESEEPKQQTLADRLQDLYGMPLELEDTFDEEGDETDPISKKERRLKHILHLIAHLTQKKAANGSLSDDDERALKKLEEDGERLCWSEGEKQFIEKLGDIVFVPNGIKECYGLVETLTKSAYDFKVSQEFACKHIKAFLKIKRSEQSLREISESKIDGLVKHNYKNLEGLLCDSLMELWHTPEAIPYATISRNGHGEHYPVESQIYTDFLTLWHYRQNSKDISESKLKSELRRHKAKARGEGKKHETALRVAEYEGRIYIDLCNEDWEAIEIGPDLPSPGWRLIRNPPVKFLRSPSMLGMPLPEDAGSEVFAELIAMLNFEDKDSEVMFMCFLICCLGVLKAYPILVLSAGEGTLKTFLLRIARRLTDASAYPDRMPPKNYEDFVTSAQYSRVPSWDNLSDMPEWLSNALCMLAYGASHGTRKLYEQGVEHLMSALRPAIIAGIGTLAVRHDLLQRSFMPKLKKVPYKTDEQAETDFLAIYPRLLGALFSAVSGAMKRLPHTQLGEDPPRMAGAFKWCLAAALDLGYSETDIRHAFNNNRAEGAAISIESSPMAQFIESKLLLPWTGTCEELLHDAQRNLKGPDKIGLPKSGTGVSNLLTRQQEAFKRMGIMITRLPRHKHRKLIRIEETAERMAARKQAQETHKTDPWCGLLAGWVARHSAGGFTSFDVYTFLGFKPYQVTIDQQQRLDNVLKELGFVAVQDKWYTTKWAEAL